MQLRDKRDIIQHARHGRRLVNHSLGSFLAPALIISLLHHIHIALVPSKRLSGLLSCAFCLACSFVGIALSLAHHLACGTLSLSCHLASSALGFPYHLASAAFGLASELAGLSAGLALSLFCLAGDLVGGKVLGCLLDLVGDIG